MSDFESRRQHLKEMSEKELEQRFWELADKAVDPMVDLAQNHTSPSIERSVLLRMGFDSMESKAIVDKCVQKELLSKGAGHVVLKVARDQGIEIKEAGRALADGKHWDRAVELFGGGK
ncbi:ornithine aminomutase subunit alpha [Natranaerobius thermophilus]|uniref:D-ornithine aminomutase S component n=1 Tax=Natranaerobius thermophilus (strain ATCC BAA-1301 / DSM 18059 / JW/NM-WN-LF) TaxID=457570 RepID=B2A1L2_NATTJ|nr:ornithine aminomutase subunit alpha [Natranaerobius thermophilus]ACB84752.1 D-ornithine aminomutase S component [Natranaerobius thermophilus JW/NM-WN-LF]